jgi:hypothetical protein
MNHAIAICFRPTRRTASAWRAVAERVAQVASSTTVELPSSKYSCAVRL